MNYIVSDHPQGTAEWKKDRAGKATGSRANDILAKIKTGEAAARKNYRVQLVTERLTGQPVDDGFVSDAMKWGTEQEPFARMAYEIATGEIVKEAGFVYWDGIQAGCSVDGFIGENGILECKCPKSATHVDYMQAGVVPSQYEPQLIHNLLITGREYADFVSFDPRMPEHLQLLIVRYERDEEKIEKYRESLMEFLAEVDQLESKLKSRKA